MLGFMPTIVDMMILTLVVLQLSHRPSIVDRLMDSLIIRPCLSWDDFVICWILISAGWNSTMLIAAMRIIAMEHMPVPIS